MATLKSLLILLAVGYIALVALTYFAQRALLYFPDRARTPPASAGLPEAEEVTIETADGEKLIAWHVPPAEGKPVVLYFHGNGGALVDRVRRFRGLIANGNGLLALSYRGYGGSSGSPSEAGLLADAAAAYVFATARYPAKLIAVFGESLGTGVAVWLAAEKPVACVILQAPYTSIVDVGAAAYPILPVRLLLKDRFPSDQRVGRITAPVLVLHGERDRIVPIEYGERLYALIRAPKKFVRFPEGDHVDLDRSGAIAIVQSFIAESCAGQK
ncbi:MAG TPA: alpha/beta fold hydrolase [Xanthobacteraceae bacterium]|nr:alpha/beta fold hydrolase [Xanthobacteraceae bacterium]